MVEAFIVVVLAVMFIIVAMVLGRGRCHGHLEEAAASTMGGSGTFMNTNQDR